MSELDLPILHLDDDLVAVSKPAGLSVHRNKHSGRDESFVLQTVSGQLGRFLFPVHRLDRATSGVLVFALSQGAARDLQSLLGTADITKEYLALVRGETPESFASERPLTSEGGTPQPAHSAFRRLATFSRCSLLEARITTGRRHQIRRHLSHLAHQVIGDTTYGKGRINRFFREEYGLPRMFLHARRLAFVQPSTGEALDLRDPLPDDLRAFLGRLPDVDDALLEHL